MSGSPFASHPLSGFGATATIKRDDAFSGPHFRCRVAGILGQHAVILDSIDGTDFQPGDSVAVQVTLRGRSIGFTSTVLHRSDHPLPHYYVGFPDEFEDLELRKNGRLPTLIPVRIVLGDDSKVIAATSSWQGMLINVSQDGCAISMKEALPVQKPLQIVLNLPGEPGEHRIDVTIVNRKNKEPVHVHGARFLRQGPCASFQAIDDWMTRARDFLV